MQPLGFRLTLLGPAAGTAILIPLTFNLDPTGAIIMLCAINYGAMYGGTITSVLVNVPGEAASVIACIDGHEMAKQGRGGAVASWVPSKVAAPSIARAIWTTALRQRQSEQAALLFCLTLPTWRSGKALSSKSPYLLAKL